MTHLVQNSFSMALFPSKLQSALVVETKATGMKLGRVLINNDIIDSAFTTSDIGRTIFTASDDGGVLTVFVSFGGVMAGAKTAKAGTIKDVPARVAFSKRARLGLSTICRNYLVPRKNNQDP